MSWKKPDPAEKTSRSGKRVKIPRCKITLKSQWKNGPIKVDVVDKLPMKGISLILGNEVKTEKCRPCKMAKMNAKNEETKMARMNSKHGKKMAKMNAKNGERKLAKMSAKNEERKMARINAKQEDKMAAEPRGRHKRHSRSQSEKVERKEVNLPHLNKQKEKRTSRQRKDESPTNNGNGFSNTYREDKRKIRESPHVAREEFEKGDEVLLLSSNKGPHCGGRYIGPYVVTRRIDKRTYRIDTHEGKKQTQVCHANKLKRYVRQEGPPRKIKNSAMPNKFEEKLSRLSVSEREGLEKLIKNTQVYFSNTLRKCSSRIFLHSCWEKEKERERN